LVLNLDRTDIMNS